MLKELDSMSGILDRLTEWESGMAMEGEKLPVKVYVTLNTAWRDPIWSGITLPGELSHKTYDQYFTRF